MEQQVEAAYLILKGTVEKFLKHSGYSVINCAELFSFIKMRDKTVDEFQLDEDEMQDEI